jgi:hypothetical protein
MPVTWLKRKYTEPKHTGRYRSSSNDQGTRGSSRRKASDAVRADQAARRPEVTLELLPSGRRRFVRVYPGRGGDR